MRRRVFPTLRAIICVIILLLAVFLSQHSQRLGLLKQRLQLQTVPSAMLSFDTFGEGLRRLGLLRVVPNDYVHYKPPSSTSWNRRQQIFQRKSQVGIQLYGVTEASPSELPSTTIIPEYERKRPEPLVSVVIDNADLYDPDTGIVTNPEKHGKVWERPAFFSYFEGGELRFASGIGLRLHGGKTRFFDMEKSFRAYFRDIYGESSLVSNIVFENSHIPLTCVVLHNDRRDKWHLVNPLAYDIAARLGAITVRTKPARFFLNGVFQGVYVLKEHLDEAYLSAHYGHDQFIFQSTKEDGTPKKLKRQDRMIFVDFQQWARQETPLTMQEVQQRVNIDNLVSWVLSIAFCSPTDANQGPVLLDKNDPHARWFWINWDMDHSFQDLYKKAAHPWEMNGFEPLSMQDARGALFFRMMEGDLEFREYFFRAFTTAMNHMLTPEFLDERLAYYENIARDYGIPERDYIEITRKFFRYRKSVLRKQMQEIFSAGPSHLCIVKNSQQQITLEIDGYVEESDYVGWYFEDMTIKVNAIPEPGYIFSHWLVNGQKVAGSRANTLEIPITADLMIEAVVIK